MDLSVLVVIEHDNQTCSLDSLKVLCAATKICSHVSACVVGHQCESVVEQVASVSEVDKVLVANNAAYAHQLAENSAKLIANHGESYTHILSCSSTFGKNLLPRVAALLDVGQLSDVIEIESPDTVVRPIYAGNALARVQSSDSIKVMTIRASSFEPLCLNTSQQATIEQLDDVIESVSSQFVSSDKPTLARPELSQARVVVSGGRGLKSKEQFALVGLLADKLGGAVGASRAAVDAGYVSNDLQVGQTGKVVAPELYIAVGISGAIQHVAGMKDSKVIVAINSDPEAAIFDIADYGLVGDLFELLPELIDSV